MYQHVSSKCCVQEMLQCVGREESWGREQLAGVSWSRQAQDHPRTGGFEQGSEQ